MGYKLNKHGLYTPIWAWRNADVKLVLNELKTCNNPIIHICSGSSSIGDIRLDRIIVNSNQHISHGCAGSANILGNMAELPFVNECARTVICDPPYDIGLITHQVYKDLINECVRILKPNGVLIYIAPWIPRHKDTLEIIKTIPLPIGLRSNNTYYKIFSVSRKTETINWNELEK